MAEDFDGFAGRDSVSIEQQLRLIQELAEVTAELDAKEAGLDVRVRAAGTGIANNANALERAVEATKELYGETDTLIESLERETRMVQENTLAWEAQSRAIQTATSRSRAAAQSPATERARQTSTRAAEIEAAVAATPREERRERISEDRSRVYYPTTAADNLAMQTAGQRAGYAREAERRVGAPAPLMLNPGSAGTPTIEEAAAAQREQASAATQARAALAAEREEMERLNQISAEARMEQARMAAAQDEVALASNREAAAFAEVDSRLSRNGALTTEFIQALARGNVTMEEFGSQMTSTIGKFGGWAVAGAAVYGVVDAFHSLYQGAAQTQEGIQTLSRFIPGVTSGSGRLAAEGEFRSISQQMNVPISDVTSAMGVMARVYKTVPGAGNAARAALLASRLDNISQSESEQYLVGTGTALGLDNGSDLIGIVNSLNALQNTYGARVSQTLPGVARAASAAASAGLNQYQVEALVGTGVRSGIPGAQIGTAINTSTEMAFRPTSEAIFQRYGITATPGHYGDLIDEISKRITNPEPGKELSGQDVLQLADALGGTRLGPRDFAPLLRNIGMYQAMVGTARDPRETAEQELGKVLGGIGEQAKRLGIELENLGSELESSGILTPIQMALEAIGTLGKVVEVAVSPFEQLGSIVSEIPGPLKDLLGLLAARSVVRYAAGTNWGFATQQGISRLPGLSGLRNDQRVAVEDTRARLEETVLPVREREYESARQRSWLYGDTVERRRTENEAAQARLAENPDDENAAQAAAGTSSAFESAQRRQTQLAADAAAAQERMLQTQTQIDVLKSKELSWEERYAQLAESNLLEMSGINASLKAEREARARSAIALAKGTSVDASGAVATAATGGPNDQQRAYQAVEQATASEQAAMLMEGAISEQPEAAIDLVTGSNLTQALSQGAETESSIGSDAVPAVANEVVAQTAAAAAAATAASIAPPTSTPPPEPEATTASEAAVEDSSGMLSRMGGYMAGLPGSIASSQMAEDIKAIPGKITGQVGASAIAGAAGGEGGGMGAAFGGLASSAALPAMIVGGMAGGGLGNAISAAGMGAFLSSQFGEGIGGGAGKLIDRAVDYTGIKEGGIGAEDALGEAGGSALFGGGAMLAMQGAGGSGVGSDIETGLGAGLTTMAVLGGPEDLPGDAVAGIVGLAAGVGKAIFGGSSSPVSSQAASADSAAGRILRSQIAGSIPNLNAQQQFGSTFQAELQMAFKDPNTNQAEQEQTAVQETATQLAELYKDTGYGTKTSASTLGLMGTAAGSTLTSKIFSEDPDKVGQILDTLSQGVYTQTGNELTYGLAQTDTNAGATGAYQTASSQLNAFYNRIQRTANPAGQTAQIKRDEESVKQAQQAIAQQQANPQGSGVFNSRISSTLEDNLAKAKGQLQSARATLQSSSDILKGLSEQNLTQLQNDAATVLQQISSNISDVASLAQASTGSKMAQAADAVSAARQTLAATTKQKGLSPEARKQDTLQDKAALDTALQSQAEQSATELQSQQAVSASLIPDWEPIEQAQVATRNAAAYYQKLKTALIPGTKNHAFDASEINQALAQKNQAEIALEDAVYQWNTQIASDTEALAQAQNPANAYAQGMAQVAQGKTDLALAKNQDERLQAQAQIAQGIAAAKEAIQTRVQTVYQTTEEEQTGDPVAQAMTALAAGYRALSMALGPDQVLQAKEQIAEAEQQLHSANQSYLQEVGAYQASLTNNTLKQDSAQIAAAQKMVAQAIAGGYGSTTVLQDQTTLHQAILQKTNDYISQRLATIQYQQDTLQISAQGALQELEGMAKLKDLSVAEKQQIAQQMYEIETDQDNTSLFDLSPSGGSSVKLPTIYDVRNNVAKERDRLRAQERGHDVGGITDMDSGKVSIGGAQVNTTGGAINTHDVVTHSKLDDLIASIRSGGIYSNSTSSSARSADRLDRGSRRVSAHSRSAGLRGI